MRDLCLLGFVCAVCSCSAEDPKEEVGVQEAVHEESANVLTADTVPKFLGWAASSNGRTVNEVRERIREVSSGPSDEAQEVADALEREFYAAFSTDFSRALVSLSVLGEIRSPVVEPALVRVLELALPARESRPAEEPNGVLHSIGMTRRNVVEMLMAKAMEGLAYQRTDSATSFVLQSLSEHESAVVRAVAASAYQWNHGLGSDVKAELYRRVRPSERHFVDRIQSYPDDGPSSRDERVLKFIADYPELRPPDPVRVAPAEALEDQATHAAVPEPENWLEDSQ